MQFEGCRMKISLFTQFMISSCFVGSLLGDLSEDILDAVGDDDVEEVKEILEENSSDLGSFINLKDPVSGQTPLMKAILHGRTEIVRLLLDLDIVDASVGEKDGYTPLHGAAFQGRADIMKMLLADRRKLDPNDYHRDGYTPLHRACWGQEQRHVDTVRVLLTAGGVHFGQKTKKPAARKGKTCKDIAGHPATIELMGEMEAVAKDHEELMRAKAEL